MHWSLIERWTARTDNGCTLNVGKSKDGQRWRWSANRYPDVHEEGEADMRQDAMAQAALATEGD